MTLFEGLMLGNSLVLLWVTYTIGETKDRHRDVIPRSSSSYGRPRLESEKP
jgi:hypothetical protein